MTQPRTAAPWVEWKVKAASIASYFGGVIALTWLESVDPETVLDVLPSPMGVLLAPLVPAGLSFVAGYVTQHTPRSSGLGEATDAAIDARVREALDRARVHVDADTGHGVIDTSDVR